MIILFTILAQVFKERCTVYINKTALLKKQLTAITGEALSAMPSTADSCLHDDYKWCYAYNICDCLVNILHLLTAIHASNDEYIHIQ